MLTATCVTLSGVQARAAPLDEPATLPRRRITSEGQDQHSSDDGPSGDAPVRSPVRCVSPEFVNAIAMNPGGRPKEVESTHRAEHMFSFSFEHWHVRLFFHAVVLLSRDTCIATARPSRRWTAARSILHPQLVVRCFPKPLHFPFRRKPLTSTCVSSPCGWQRALWSSLKVTVNTEKKIDFTVHYILTEYCISPVLIFFY